MEPRHRGRRDGFRASRNVDQSYRARSCGGCDGCADAVLNGSVARLSRDRPSVSPKKSHSALVYVVPDVGGPPKPDAPFAIAYADGLVRVGTTDRRGAVFDPTAPEGDVTLVRL